MSKINLETFKKLLSVKKGGAEFFRLVVKLVVWIFALGAIFYGLIWVPNQMLSLEGTKIKIEALKTQRQCEASSRNNVLALVEAAKKQKKEIKEEDQRKIFVSGYNQCVFLSGMDFLVYKEEQKTK